MFDTAEYNDHQGGEIRKRHAFLVGVRFPGDSRFEARMEELRGLAEACGAEVRGTADQKLPREDSAYFIGKGKVEEIRLAADSLHADLVIFNNTLSPSQLTNLSEALELEVIDRTNLILNIFAERARSREARMQVDYAKLKFMLPRLVGLRANLSRQGGASGSMSNRGAGEKKIELDRRRIEKRMALLRRSLDEIAKERETQRKRRARSGMPLISLVGYTNAGKSTLMNQMIRCCGTDDEKQVLEQDMLFATLDTSVRQIAPSGRRPFLLSDTVGFIDDLPTGLVDAFRSTLDEALHADLILMIVDSTDPEYRNHIQVTEETLAELGAGSIPVITVMNKNDGIRPILEKDRILMSAKDPDHLPALLDLIEAKLNEGSLTCTLLIPYAQSRLENVLRESGVVKSCEYTDDGIRITAAIRRDRIQQFQEYLQE